MVLVKRSQKNQVVIPKSVLDQAGIAREDRYLKVDYSRRLGAILLWPVSIEEKIPPQTLERFEAKVVKGQRGDRRFQDMDEAITYLRSLPLTRRSRR